MRRLLDNWFNISVFLACGAFVVLGIGDFDARERLILASGGLLFVHFFEEFGYPGGFPWIGLHVEMGVTDTDTRSWTLNNLNSLIGNWWFIVVVYAAAFFLPDVRFLTVAVGVMAVLEVLMHLVGFNIGLRSWYNPGLATALMLGIVAAAYFIPAIAASLFTWVDLALALAWVGANYWFVFRSPFYVWTGSKKQFSFPQDEVLKAQKYIDACKKRADRKASQES